MIISILLAIFSAVGIIFGLRLVQSWLETRCLIQANHIQVMLELLREKMPFDISTIQSLKQKIITGHYYEESRTPVKFLRQNTAIGRFSLKSETESNPSVLSFFVCITHEPGNAPSLNEFKFMWKTRVMDKHHRFRSRICAWDDHFFDTTPIDYDKLIMYAAHPFQKDKQLDKSLVHFLTQKIDVTEQLWEIKVSTGKIGESGALPKEKIDNLLKSKPTFTEETIFLFRVHHVLADGFSMSVALGDACDESLQLRRNIESTVNSTMQSKSTSFFKVFERIFVYFIFGSLLALSYQLWLMLTSTNPFHKIILHSTIPPGKRTISWRVLGQVDEVKKVAKLVSSKGTINDVVVSCVLSAIENQLVVHQSSFKFRTPSHINIVIPVHLPTMSTPFEMRNRIGGFVAKLPLKSSSEQLPGISRLKSVSKSLLLWKATPAALISWTMAKVCSDFLPENIAKVALRKGNANATAVVSNIKGFPFGVHWMGRPVTFLSAFLPLPPGIPIGVVIQSYNGEISFTIDADERVIPDADKFSSWMLTEYRKLVQEVTNKSTHTALQ